MAKSVTCACGASFSAVDDAELFKQIRKHADEVHNDLRMTDDQLWALLGRNARDAGA